jgi:ABC-type nitrate/sulfonate/bicarbonate transport system substrate-binding protein
MGQLRVAGVPEHFNLPWYLLAESSALNFVDVDIDWRDVPEGTGAMIDMLDSGEADLAMLLTEGAVKGIAGGARYRIVSHYTTSPIVWGIHVAADSEFRTVDQLRGARYAISRAGSGSQLMAMIHAREQGWPAEELEFRTVGTIDGARRALARGEADVFLWERFMTAPLVDSGEFRRIGTYPTPWSCFVACANQSALALRGETIAQAMRGALISAAELVADPAAAAMIARRFGLRRREAEKWLMQTSWAEEPGIDDAMIARVAETLMDAGVVDDIDGVRFTSPL